MKTVKNGQKQSKIIFFAETAKNQHAFCSDSNSVKKNRKSQESMKMSFLAPKVS